MNQPGNSNRYLNLYITIQDTIAKINQYKIKESQNQIAALKLSSKEQEIDQLNQETQN